MPTRFGTDRNPRIAPCCGVSPRTRLPRETQTMIMLHNTLSTIVLLISFCLVSAAAVADDAKPADKQEAPKVTYQDHILPIFRAKCGSCHNANDRKGNLVLDDYAAMREGGGSGAVVEPGDPDS